MIRAGTRNLFIPFLLILLSGLLGGGCSTLRNTGGGGGESKNWRNTLRNCSEKAVLFQTLTISGKAVADIPSMNFDMSVNYRIQAIADSAVMIRFTKIGFEAARVLITRDSIHIIDRTKRTYQVEGLDKLTELTGLDPDLRMVQDLLIGNLYQIPDQLEVREKRGNPQVFAGSKSGTDFSYAINTNNYRLTRLEAINSERNQHSTLSYKDFKEYDSQLVSISGLIKVFLPEPLSFDFRHSKVEIDPEKFSLTFEVPGNYDRLP
jgi:hypothetical protein